MVTKLFRTEPLPDTPEVIKCRDFLNKNITVYNRINSTWLFQGERDSNSGINSACHAAMRKVNKPKALASAFSVNEERYEDGIKFWNFITSDKSPYRSLMENGIELVHEPGVNLKGFILPEETVVPADSYFLKNFCILMRGIIEWGPCLRAWRCLTEAGLSPEEAFYLCYNFQVHDNGTSVVYRTTDNLNGSHWPLTDGYGYYSNFIFDWTAWKSGKPNKRSDEMPVNSCWCKLKKLDPNYRPFISERAKYLDVLGITKTKFSQVKILTVDDIVTAFNNWKKDMDID